LHLSNILFFSFLTGLGLGAGLSSQGNQTATAAMQNKIMDQVKYLEPLKNDRLVLKVEEAMKE